MAEPSPADLRIVPLNNSHDRASFTCGVESLGSYFKTQAGQDLRRKANAVFVLSTETMPECVLGYYALCAMAVAQGRWRSRKAMCRQPLESTSRVVPSSVAPSSGGSPLRRRSKEGDWDQSCTRTRFGVHTRVPTVGSSMVIVEALDDMAAGFYTAHGFVRRPDSMRLVLPMRQIAGRSD